MFGKMIEMLKSKSRKLVFTEGTDVRILMAADRLNKERLLVPVLLGPRPDIEKLAAENGVDLTGMEIVTPDAHAGFEEMVQKLAELRKGKMTEEECRTLMHKNNYFGTMMVKMGMADGLLGGATYSTADTVRPALQIVRAKPGNSVVSSCFIMEKPTDKGSVRYAMADCAINLDPNVEEVVEITRETAEMAKMFGIDPKVALLSFSSHGSGKGESPEKMRAATERLQTMNLDYPVDGELQFDAAFAPEVGKLKAPDSKVAGEANVFIFPNIDAGNIGYKIAQRLGGFEALGPILLGLSAPINDLSRGCTSDEVYKMAIITAANAH